MFEIIPSEEIAFRCDLALLANARGVKDAVEVGTDLGVFAAEFLRRFEGNWLFCVDDYSARDEFPCDRTGDLMTAVAALMPHHGRFRIVRHPSPEAIPFVLSLIQRPGLVYIDGAHDEASVTRDIEAWWEALAPDGLLCGHDFDEAHDGVRRAVERFARERGLVVRLTHEKSSPPSWYCYKGGEPPTLFKRLFTDAEEPNPRAVG